ncbi:MAG: HEAT repeat domain-containing protein [Flavobacteriaceae bacterium]
MNLKEHIQAHKETFDDQQMSSKADDLFKDRLQKEFHQPKKGKVIYLKYLSVASSIAILFTIGFLMYNSDNQNDRKQLLANLQDDSTGTRLEAVYEFDDAYQKEDQEIIKVLIKTLLDDKSNNVKIATIDALLKFPQNEEIRKSFIKAIGQEKEPLVQIKLINSLSILRDQRAKKPLEKIINNKETFPIVKNNASLAMANLKE